MKLGYDLTIEQTQKLTMTPELIQAIQILQFNTQELDSFVQSELMQNPVLEYEGNDDNKKEPELNSGSFYLRSTRSCSPSGSRSSSARHRPERG